MSVQDRCTVCAKRTIGSEIIYNTSMVLLGDRAQVEARFGLFRGSANLDASTSTVCAERTTVSEIVLDAHEGTAR